MCVGLGLFSALDFVFTYSLAILTLHIVVYTTVSLENFVKLPKKFPSCFLVFFFVILDLFYMIKPD